MGMSLADHGRALPGRDARMTRRSFNYPFGKNTALYAWIQGA